MRLSLIALAIPVLLARGAQSPAKPPPKPQEEPRYLQATVIDVSATVANVTETPRANPLSGRHLDVTSDSGSFDVYLGPLDYLADFEIVFRKGDRIQVIGSKIRSGDTNFILAREVRRGVATVILRNVKGEPYWTAKSPPGK